MHCLDTWTLWYKKLHFQHVYTNYTTVCDVIYCSNLYYDNYVSVLYMFLKQSVIN